MDLITIYSLNSETTLNCVNFEGIGIDLYGKPNKRSIPDQMNYPAASCGVSRTARSEANFGEYDPERFNYPCLQCLGVPLQ